MLVLRRCEADEKPGATCSSFTTWDAYRMVDDAVLLGAVLYWLGSDLVVTLHHAELMGSPGVRRARQRMAKGWAVTLWLVYAVFWMALPIAELLRSTLPRPISSYDLPLGDLAVRHPYRALQACHSLQYNHLRPCSKSASPPPPRPSFWAPSLPTKRLCVARSATTA